MSVDPGAQEIVIDGNIDNELHSDSEEESSEEDNSGWEDSSEEESSGEESCEGEEAEPQEIVIDENVDNQIRSGALRKRLQDRSLGKGTVTLIIRDPNITIIGDINLGWDDREDSPLFGCKSLLHVNLKGCTKLTQMGDRVFYECSSLTSVTLPDGLTQLGDYVFYECSSLTSVTLPDGLTQLGGSVFFGCSSLTSVSLPDGLTQLGDYVFWGCSSLTSVSLPDGLTQLGSYVFHGCSSLTSAANSAGFNDVAPYLRDRYKCVTLRKLFLRLLGKYNQAVNEANGTEAEKNAIALANFPTDNSSTLDVGLFLQTMNASGGDGVKGLVGYILKFV